MNKISFFLLIISAHFSVFGQNCLQMEWSQVFENYTFNFKYISDFEQSNFYDDLINPLSDTIEVKKELSKKGNNTIRANEVSTTVPNEEEYMIYKNFINETVFTFDRILGEERNVIIKEPFPVTKWVYAEEKDEIMGFTVQKATGEHLGREYVVWFAPDIPLSDGPRRLNGLPLSLIHI